MISQIARLIAGLFVLSSGLASAAPAISMERACEALGSKLRSISVSYCQKSGLKPSNFTSVRGQPILYRDYTARTPQSDKPYRVLLLGGIHGDELTAVDMGDFYLFATVRTRLARLHSELSPGRSLKRTDRAAGKYARGLVRCAI